MGDTGINLGRASTDTAAPSDTGATKENEATSGKAGPTQAKQANTASKQRTSQESWFVPPEMDLPTRDGNQMAYSSVLTDLASFYTKSKVPDRVTGAYDWERNPAYLTPEKQKIILDSMSSGRILVCHDLDEYRKGVLENPNVIYGDVPKKQFFYDVSNPTYPTGSSNPNFPEYTVWDPSTDVTRIGLETNGNIFWEVDTELSPGNKISLVSPPKTEIMLGSVAYKMLVDYVGNKPMKSISTYYYVTLPGYMNLRDDILDQIQNQQTNPQSPKEITLNFFKVLEPVGNKESLEGCLYACMLFGFLRDATSIDLKTGNVTFANAEAAKINLDLVCRRPNVLSAGYHDGDSYTTSFFTTGQNTENVDDDTLLSTSYTWKTWDLLLGIDWQQQTNQAQFDDHTLYFPILIDGDGNPQVVIKPEYYADQSLVRNGFKIPEGYASLSSLSSEAQAAAIGRLVARKIIETPGADPMLGGVPPGNHITNDDLSKTIITISDDPHMFVQDMYGNYYLAVAAFFQPMNANEKLSYYPIDNYDLGIDAIEYGGSDWKTYEEAYQIGLSLNQAAHQEGIAYEFSMRRLAENGEDVRFSETDKRDKRYTEAELSGELKTHEGRVDFHKKTGLGERVYKFAIMRNDATDALFDTLLANLDKQIADAKKHIDELVNSIGNEDELKAVMAQYRFSDELSGQVLAANGLEAQKTFLKEVLIKGLAIILPDSWPPEMAMTVSDTQEFRGAIADAKVGKMDRFVHFVTTYQLLEQAVAVIPQGASYAIAGIFLGVVLKFVTTKWKPMRDLERDNYKIMHEAGAMSTSERTEMRKALEEKGAYFMAGEKAVLAGKEWYTTKGRANEVRAFLQFFYNRVSDPSYSHKQGSLIADTGVGKDVVAEMAGLALKLGYYPDGTPVEKHILAMFGDVMITKPGVAATAYKPAYINQKKNNVEELKALANEYEAQTGRRVILFVSEGVSGLKKLQITDSSSGPNQDAYDGVFKEETHLCVAYAMLPSAAQDFYAASEGSAAGEIERRVGVIPMPLDEPVTYTTQDGQTGTTGVVNIYVGMSEMRPVDTLLFLQEYVATKQIPADVAALMGAEDFTPELLKEIIIYANETKSYGDPGRSRDVLNAYWDKLAAEARRTGQAVYASIDHFRSNFNEPRVNTGRPPITLDHFDLPPTPEAANKPNLDSTKLKKDMPKFDRLKITNPKKAKKAVVVAPPAATTTSPRRAARPTASVTGGTTAAATTTSTTPVQSITAPTPPIPAPTPLEASLSKRISDPAVVTQITDTVEAIRAHDPALAAELEKNLIDAKNQIEFQAALTDLDTESQALAQRIATQRSAARAAGRPAPTPQPPQSPRESGYRTDLAAVTTNTDVARNLAQAVDGGNLIESDAREFITQLQNPNANTPKQFTDALLAEIAAHPDRVFLFVDIYYDCYNGRIDHVAALTQAKGGFVGPLPDQVALTDRIMARTVRLVGQGLSRAEIEEILKKEFGPRYSVSGDTLGRVGGLLDASADAQERAVNPAAREAYAAQKTATAQRASRQALPKTNLSDVFDVSGLDGLSRETVSAQIDARWAEVAGKHGLGALEPSYKAAVMELWLGEWQATKFDFTTVEELNNYRRQLIEAKQNGLAPAEFIDSRLRFTESIAASKAFPKDQLLRASPRLVTHIPSQGMMAFWIIGESIMRVSSQPNFLYMDSMNQFLAVASASTTGITHAAEFVALDTTLKTMATRGITVGAQKYFAHFGSKNGARAVTVFMESSPIKGFLATGPMIAAAATFAVVAYKNDAEMHSRLSAYARTGNPTLDEIQSQMWVEKSMEFSTTTAPLLLMSIPLTIVAEGMTAQALAGTISGSATILSFPVLPAVAGLSGVVVGGAFMFVAADAAAAEYHEYRKIKTANGYMQAVREQMELSGGTTQIYFNDTAAPWLNARLREDYLSDHNWRTHFDALMLFKNPLNAIPESAYAKMLDAMPAEDFEITKRLAGLGEMNLGQAFTALGVLDLTIGLTDFNADTLLGLLVCAAKYEGPKQLNMEMLKVVAEQNTGMSVCYRVAITVLSGGDAGVHNEVIVQHVPEQGAELAAAEVGQQESAGLSSSGTDGSMQNAGGTLAEVTAFVAQQAAITLDYEGIDRLLFDGDKPRVFMRGIIEELGLPGHFDRWRSADYALAESDLTLGVPTPARRLLIENVVSTLSRSNHTDSAVLTSDILNAAIADAQTRVARVEDFQEREYNTQAHLAALEKAWTGFGADYQYALEATAKAICLENDVGIVNDRVRLVTAMISFVKARPELAQILVNEYGVDWQFVSNIPAGEFGRLPEVLGNNLYHITWDDRVMDFSEAILSQNEKLGLAVAEYKEAVKANDGELAADVHQIIADLGYVTYASELGMISGHALSSNSFVLLKDKTVPRLDNETDAAYLKRQTRIWSERLALYACSDYFCNESSAAEITIHMRATLEQYLGDIAENDPQVENIITLAWQEFNTLEFNDVLRLLAEDHMAAVSSIEASAQQFGVPFIWDAWQEYYRGANREGEQARIEKHQRAWLNNYAGGHKAHWDARQKSNLTYPQISEAAASISQKGLLYADSNSFHVVYTYLSESKLPRAYRTSIMNQDHMMEDVLKQLYAIDPALKEHVGRCVFGEAWPNVDQTGQIMTPATYAMLVRLSADAAVEFLAVYGMERMQRQAESALLGEWLATIDLIAPDFVATCESEDDAVSDFIDFYIPQIVVAILAEGVDYTDRESLADVITTVTQGAVMPGLSFNQEVFDQIDKMISYCMGNIDQTIEWVEDIKIANDGYLDPYVEESLAAVKKQQRIS